MAKESKNRWFISSFITLLLSIGAFYGFRELLPERLFAEIAVESDNIAVDSLMLLAASGVSLWEDFAEEDDEEKADFLPGLISFFQKLFALEKTKNNAVRIAFFTDSMTEGDLIVRDIRKDYQNKYGGEGIGFVAPNIALLGFSIFQNFSEEGWDTHSFLKRRSGTFGVSGYTSYANASSVWASYRRLRDGFFPLVRPTVFYGRSANTSAKITVTAGQGTAETFELEPTEILNTRQLALPAASTWNIRFSNARNIPFYGVDFSGGTGVNIDNFPTRGSAGLPLGNLDRELMNAFQEVLRYDLIILHFGANVLHSQYADYGWYGEAMTNVVHHLRGCFPGASVLVISSADMARRYGTVLRTDTRLASLLQAQENYAHITEAGFINLFELMGGEGTMVQWSRRSPTLVQADFVHFGIPGTKKIADLIFNKLEEEYENYKMENHLSIGDGEDGII